MLRESTAQHGLGAADDKVGVETPLLSCISRDERESHNLPLWRDRAVKSVGDGVRTQEHQLRVELGADEV